MRNLLDLGAPVVVDTGIVITPAGYGLNNGHITGLTVIGTEPLSYRWFDHINDTIGTALDLHDVFAGNYFLQVTDTNYCVTDAGPYLVDLVEHVSEVNSGPSGIISVFPNPNGGTFTIHIGSDVARISVINMLGEIVYTFDNGRPYDQVISVDLRQNGNGIYRIRAVTLSGQSVTKVVQVF